MPLLCLKCDTRVTGSLTKPTFYCPECDKELTRDEVYKVGKRFFASGVGMMLAVTAAMSSTFPTTRKALITKEEATSTFMEAKRQKRKKLKGLKMRQRKQERRKRNG